MHSERMRLRGQNLRVLLAVLAFVGMLSACAPPFIGVIDKPGGNSPGNSSGGGSGGGNASGGHGSGNPGGLPDSSAGSPDGLLKCDQPDSSSDFERANPQDVGLTSDALYSAIQYAAARGAQSVRVYRNDCLIGSSGNDAETSWSRLPAWSMTKGVVSIVAGRAQTLGLLDVDASIGEYIQGLNESQKRITVRNLLNQNSGMRFAWLNDLNDAAEFDSVKRLFKRPFAAEPGTQFIYAQTTVTALVAAVEGAVGEDFQAFAAREVFEPIGITKSDWTWDRDGSGRTQGFAFLDMTPKAFARLGSLLLNKGAWDGRQLVSADYIMQGSTGSSTNTNYGFLWRTNLTPAGVELTDDSIQDSIRSATPQTYWLSGMFNQNVFVLPELDIVVVRMGLPADVFADPFGDVSGERPKWEHNFFRSLLAGVTDVDIPDPGPWQRLLPDAPVISSDQFLWIDWAGLGLG